MLPEQKQQTHIGFFFMCVKNKPHYARSDRTAKKEVTTRTSRIYEEKGTERSESAEKGQKKDEMSTLLINPIFLTQYPAINIFAQICLLLGFVSFCGHLCLFSGFSVLFLELFSQIRVVVEFCASFELVHKRIHACHCPLFFRQLL